MTIKTTLNLKYSQSKKLYSIADQYNVSLSFIINTLTKKIQKSHSFSMKTMHRVQYQERCCDESDFWDPIHVSFTNDTYEKCLDMRNVFKISVSLLFAFAIKKFLKELIMELNGEKESDNYAANYTILYSNHGSYCHITHLWNEVEPKKMKEIKRTHIKTE